MRHSGSGGDYNGPTHATAILAAILAKRGGGLRLDLAPREQ